MVTYNAPPTRASGYVITSSNWTQDVVNNLIAHNDFIGHPDGGHVNLTDGGILLGNGVGAVVAMAVLAKGSMPVGDGTTDPGVLTVGTDSEFLTADSGEALGIKWASPTILSNPEDIMLYA